MVKEVKLPEVSDNIENGDVVKVLVAVGDTIEMDQPIIELETDKAMFEVPSTEKGVIKEIKVKQGDVINIGQVILTVETNGEESKKDSGEKESDKNSEKSDGKKDEKPKDSEGENKKEDSKKDSKVKEKIDNKQKEEKKDSGDSEEKPKKAEKEEAKKEVKDDEEAKSDTDKDKSENKEKDKEESSRARPTAAASPSVRRLARELGVNIELVNGTESGGKISEGDIKNFVKEKISGGGNSALSQRSLPDFEKWGEVDVQPMSKIRTVTAESLSYAWTTIPMVTQFDKADITGAEEFRRKNAERIKEAGGHLTITSILVKICTAALKSFPQFNSSIDFNNREIVYKKFFNIGVAVDTDRGLLVPVIKNTDRKTITEISSELNSLAEKARNKKITLEEMDGGNFTISNLGGIGGTNFTPIIYSPQVAILGVSRGAREQIYFNEKFEARLMLPLTLTYDHRIIDGADAARFLRWICEALENPMMMIL